jgi:hypothetical protein
MTQQVSTVIVGVSAGTSVKLDVSPILISSLIEGYKASLLILNFISIMQPQLQQLLNQRQPNLQHLLVQIRNLH